MPINNSHLKARDFFNTTVKSYLQRSNEEVFSFSSLVFKRRNVIVEKFLECIPSKGRVLDFGMGPGVFCKFCTKKGLFYLGLDISSKMVEEAKALELNNAEFEVGDIEALSKYNLSMDAVLAIGLIDYLEYPEHGIKSLADCVKSNGYLILSFRNRYSLPRYLRDWTKSIWRRLLDQKKYHSQKAFFSEIYEHSFDFSSQLKPLLIKLGFHKFEVSYFNCSPFFFNFPLHPLIFKKWYKWDLRFASKYFKRMCSGGVLICKKIADQKV